MAETTIKCHEVERFENLMYKGCEPHWHCIHCDNYWPFHCYGRKDLEQMECPAYMKSQREDESASDMRDYCERYEPTYNPEDHANTEKGRKTMPQYVEFHHGALSDPYEKQANDQGFTLGKERERLEKLGFSLVYCWIHKVLTDSQYDMALKKLQKQLMKALKRLPPKEEKE